MQITSEMSIPDVQTICEKFIDVIKYHETQIIKDELALRLALKKISPNLKSYNAIKEDLATIEKSRENFEKDKIKIIVDLINYIFDNQINLNIEEHYETGEYKDGKFHPIILTFFSGVLADELYQLLHQDSHFVLCYNGSKLPKKYSFIGKNKKAFFKTLNLYTCEGEKIEDVLIN